MKFSQINQIRKQRGLTLLETMLVIAIIAVFAGSILYLYLSVKSDQEVQQETTNITKIVGKVEAAYKNSSDFGTADKTTLTKFVANSKGFENMKNDDALASVWGSAVTVEPVSGKKYLIVYESVPKAECVTLATNVAGQMKDFQINGTAVKVSGGDFDPLKAEENCAAADNVKMEFYPRGK